MKDIYDIVIIGGGPSGLTAGLYACRARMKVLLMERALCGGQMLVTDTIENFPGFPGGIKGPELGDWMLKQASRFGLEVMTAEAMKIAFKKGTHPQFSIGTAGGKAVAAVSVIVSTGARWNSLGIPGEKELMGRGVSYCATCDGPLFKGKSIIVIGGGDTALEDAIFLTRFAAKVTIVHRRDRLRATKILQERAFADKKIDFCLNSVAMKIDGKERCTGLEIKDVRTLVRKRLPADGVFVLIGTTPNSDIAKGLVDTDENGYIICDGDMKTSMEGVFACGDVRRKLLRQVVTAAGDGATAAFSAQQYVERLKGTEYK